MLALIAIRSRSEDQSKEQKNKWAEIENRSKPMTVAPNPDIPTKKAPTK
jgi:hypothetical protein